MASEMAAPDGWITVQSLCDELDASGYPVSERQLERWRNAGLLPAVKQLGNYDGSVTWCPPTTLPQSIALQRVLQVKNRIFYAGQVLWAAGFEVDERYWAPALESADRLLRRAAPIARFILDKVDEKFPDTTLGELIVRPAHLNGALAKMARRLDQQETVFAVDKLMEIVAGDFETFGVAATDRDDFDPAAAIQTAFDLDKGAQDQVFGKRLKLGQALEGVLADVSAAQVGVKLADFSASEIAAARDDVRNALKIAVCFYESVSWIYGDEAFGLRLANFLARTLPGNLIYTMTIGIARLRRNQANLYSSFQIAEMADQAEQAWLPKQNFAGQTAP